MQRDGKFSLQSLSDVAAGNTHLVLQVVCCNCR